MFNLEQLVSWTYPNIGDVKFIFSNESGDKRFLVSSDAKIMYAVSYKETGPTSLLYSTGLLSSELNVECSPIINIHYFPEDKSIAVSLKSGHLYLVYPEEGDFDTETTCTTEEIGCFPDGIDAMQASPDGSILSIATSSQKLHFLMRSIMDPILEIDLANAKPINDFVSVGWGTEETQFQGPSAKKVGKTVIENKPLCLSDKNVKLSWHQGENQSFLSCNVTNSASNTRRILVFNREGVLISVTNSNFLSNNLEWSAFHMIASTSFQPSTSIISEESSQMNSNFSNHTESVVFFETNGLSHGDFNVPFGVESISWNTDGSILALGYKDRTELWVVRNFHWYRKYSLFKKARWDPIDSLGLWSSDGRFIRLLRKLTVITDLVAVVDGHRLLLTAFSIANIPPPSSLFQISTPSCHITEIINATALVQLSEKTFSIAMSTSLNRVFTWKLNIINEECVIQREAEFKNEVPVTQLLFDRYSKKLMLNDCSHIGRLIDEDASLIFTREGIIESHFDSTTYIDMKVHCSVIHKVTFDDVDHFVGLSSAKDDLVIDGRIIASDCKSLHITNDFVCTADSFGYIRFLPIKLIRTVTDQVWNSIDWKREENGRLSEDGAMIICTDPDKCSMVIQIIPRGNLETFYPRAFVLSKIRAALSLANYTEAFVLCRRHRIDLNILHDCQPALFFATIPKFVQCLGKAEYLNLFLSALKPENICETRYSAYISGASSCAVEFLESKVDRICESIRKHLLQIKDPKYAESLITTFVCQSVSDIKSALQFIISASNLSCPSEESIKNDKFTSIKTDYVLSKDQSSQTNAVSDKNELVNESSQALDSSIDPGSPSLSSGTSLSELDSKKSLNSDPEINVERMLKYLLFLVNPQILYKESLGLYNLPLALSVARRSQMDPAEYVPFLESIESAQPQSIRLFMIDDHLGRYDLALGHLLCLDSDWKDFQIIDYMKKHHLHSTAFALINNLISNSTAPNSMPPPRLNLLKNLICKVYAEHILNTETDPFKLGKAVDLFRFAGLLEEAKTASIQCGCWQDLLHPSNHPISHEDQRKICENLISQQRFKEATRFAEMCGNHILAFNLCISLRQWSEAHFILRIKFTTDEAKILEFRELLISSYNGTIDDLQSVMAEFDTKSSRLEFLIKQLIEALTTKPESEKSNPLGSIGALEDISDQLSEMSFRTNTSNASSLHSVISAATSLSSVGSKSRKKQRQRGKAGSPFEREHIRDTLNAIFTKIENIRNDSDDLISVLSQMELFMHASKLQNLMIHVLKMVWNYKLKINKLLDLQEKALLDVESLQALGIASPSAVPEILLVTFEWRRVFYSDNHSDSRAPFTESVPYVSSPIFRQTETSS